MRIANNITALTAATNLLRTDRKMQISSQKLSSGFKINSVKEDAAGLAVANKLRQQISGLHIANRNTLDGVSMIQTAEGSLSEVHSMLQRMRELSVEAATDTLDDNDREKLQDELDQLTNEIDGLAQKTQFNKIKLIGGEVDNFKIQVGANSKQEIRIDIPKFSKETLNLDQIKITTQQEAVDSIARFDELIEYTSAVRSKLGALQNRLEANIANTDQVAFSMQQAVSRIIDTDMAFEMMNYTQQNIISQAGVSILAQANQRPQQILQLLGR